MFNQSLGFIRVTISNQFIMRFLTILSILFFTVTATAQTVVCQLDDELKIQYIENETIRQITYKEHHGGLIVSIEFNCTQTMEWQSEIQIMSDLCNGFHSLEFKEQYESEDVGVVDFYISSSIADCVIDADVFVFNF